MLCLVQRAVLLSFSTALCRSHATMGDCCVPVYVRFEMSAPFVVPWWRQPQDTCCLCLVSHLLPLVRCRCLLPYLLPAVGARCRCLLFLPWPLVVQEEDTMRAIIAASNLPLSIVMIGKAAGLLVWPAGCAPRRLNSFPLCTASQRSAGLLAVRLGAASFRPAQHHTRLLACWFGSMLCGARWGCLTAGI